MIDGTIARKTETVSSFGSKLDTASDLVFMAVCAVKLLPKINICIWLWIWIAVIAIVKVTNIVIGFIRRKKLVALHTVLNKTTGLLLFFLPLTLQFIVPTYSLAVVCTVATIAAVSVRRRCVPSVMGVKPFSSAKLISSGEKSPSGPIKIKIFSFFLIIDGI